MICTSSRSSLSKAWLVAGFWLATFFLCLNAHALDPHTLLSQYGHTSWKTQDGLVNRPTAIAQTTDGYIWIVSSNTLLRFDGVRFTLWTPPQGQAFAGRGISALLGARDGSLWIGTFGGLSHLKDGKLINYKTTPKSPGISAIIEDPNGTIWFTRYRVNDGMGPLCRVDKNALRCYGEKDGISARYGLGLAEDGAGNIWFGSNFLCRWSPGSSSVYFKEMSQQKAFTNVNDVAVGPAGSVWAALDGTGPKLGVQYYSNGKWASYIVPGFNGATVRSSGLYMDRNRSLWVATESQGLYRIHDGIADHYGSGNGLSGNSVKSIYEDREGNIWVATDRGLDMFRDMPVVTYSPSEGLIGSSVHSVLGLKNGSVWVGNEEALDIINAGHISTIAVGHGLPGQDVNAVFEDSTGQIWLGIDDRIVMFSHGRFVDAQRLNGNPAGRIGVPVAFTEDTDGNIWAAILINGIHQGQLVRIRGKRIEKSIPEDDFIREAQFVAADRDSGIWVGSVDGKLARYRNGKVDGVVALQSNGVPVSTNAISVDADNALWAATTGGLFRWKDGRLSVMDSRNGLPCSAFYSAIEDNYGSMWISARCGLLMIPKPDLVTWMKEPESKVSVRTFTALDGVQTGTQPGQPLASRSRDGRLWFDSGFFVQMVDPDRISGNGIPPPVQVEEVVADRKGYSPSDGLRLAPRTHDLEIRYTALSLTLPQRVRFRYMLQGQDKTWQDVGTRREAFYTNLDPGHYTFHVIACNNDGVWNETGAEFGFDIQPAYYQTLWFRILVSLAAVAALSSLYFLRLKQATDEVKARLGERMYERERIARDLHDTLLQGFQGLMLRFQAVMEEIPENPVNRSVRGKMEKVLERADEVLLEGRESVSKLRAEAKHGDDLAQAIASVGEELAEDHACQFNMAIVGTPQPLDPVVLDEAYRIAREALVNAFGHSNASKIEGEMTYDSARVRLSIRDNGDGIAPEILKSGRTGHWGLSGMRERAQNVGGQLNVWSNPGAGTEIELILPASVAYQRGARGLRWKWIRRAVSGGR
jgi:signal transduction histidine kinase/ligand-binding sensor domain-containing protein